MSSFGLISSILFIERRQNDASQRRCSSKVRETKELYFNMDGSPTKKLQIGVNKLANLVGVTLGPKGRNVAFKGKYGSPNIVNDGVTVAKEVELEDPVKNIGTKLVRQAAANTNDLAGWDNDFRCCGSWCKPGSNYLRFNLLFLKIEDSELADVAVVSVGNNYEVGKMIAEAMSKVGRKRVATLEEGKSSENSFMSLKGFSLIGGNSSQWIRL
ncbi:hypothetical protein GIB67_033498 [Kingdonia uniflora]|uniref:Uncharacterized protein n=1 Tax=Kingdonia uniflora TaxID=39325 RepID=A0A7J7L687_9MAGN|nr:hypothetical protein GIB67_033498 [Kingdonia uniflora]